MQSVNPLQHFFSEPNMVFNKDAKVQWSVFQEKYKQFCERYGYPKNTRWEKTFYKSVFDKYNLEKKRMTAQTSNMTKPKMDDSVMGMMFVDGSLDTNSDVPHPVSA